MEYGFCPQLVKPTLINYSEFLNLSLKWPFDTHIVEMTYLVQVAKTKGHMSPLCQSLIKHNFFKQIKLA